jgi:hypothetical protein
MSESSGELTTDRGESVMDEGLVELVEAWRWMRRQNRGFDLKGSGTVATARDGRDRVFASLG